MNLQDFPKDTEGQKYLDNSHKLITVFSPN